MLAACQGAALFEAERSPRASAVGVCHTLSKDTRAVIDAWINLGLETVATWDFSSPYLSIHDISHPQLMLTAYARERTKEVVALLPDNLARSAIVIPQSLLGEMFRLFVYLDMMRLHSSLERRVLFSRKQAVEWLAEALSDEVT